MATQQELDEYLKRIKQSESNQECPIKSTLRVIGGKWKLCIIMHLFRKDVVRFNELKNEMSGITNAMLSNSLHELELDQLVIRKQYNEMPLRVEYSLSEKGISMLPLIYELYTWGKRQNN